MPEYSLWAQLIALGLRRRRPTFWLNNGVGYMMVACLYQSPSHFVCVEIKHTPSGRFNHRRLVIAECSHLGIEISGIDRPLTVADLVPLRPGWQDCGANESTLSFDLLRAFVAWASDIAPRFAGVLPLPLRT